MKGPALGSLGVPRGASAYRVISSGFRDPRRNPTRFIPRQQFRRRSPPRLILEIDIGERLSAVVADDETGGLFFD
jgi:hypothetical protein